MPYQRSIFRHPINWKIDRKTIKIVTANDYEKTGATPLDVPAVHQLHYLPYCIDLAAERMIYTVTDRAGIDDILAASFMYMGQRTCCNEILSVPLERVAELDDGTDISATFVFSPGRTGSTLLSKLLTAAGRESVSEPDILTQLALFGPNEMKLIGENGFKLATRASLVPIAKYCTDRPFIKLRSQCTGRAGLLASAVAGSKIAFMFRNKDDWATSRRGHFNESPVGLAQTLAANVAKLDSLKRSGWSPITVVYERLVTDTLAELKLLAPDIDIGDQRLRDAINEVLATDSQKDSPLNRNRTNMNHIPPDFIEEFNKEWSAIKPAAIIARHQLEDVLG